MWIYTVITQAARDRAVKRHERFIEQATDMAIEMQDEMELLKERLNRLKEDVDCAHEQIASLRLEAAVSE